MISKIRRRSVLRSIDNHPYQFSAASGSKRDNNTNERPRKTRLLPFAALKVLVDVKNQFPAAVLTRNYALIT